jgi:16S rRNA (guanine1207-N2)-methyltransferase
VKHSATGPTCGAGAFDVAVANPPYYAGFRIARFFLETAHAALRPGGRVYVVNKQPDWYVENMSQWFRGVTVARSKEYWIARGTK